MVDFERENINWDVSLLYTLKTGFLMFSRDIKVKHWPQQFQKMKAIEKY